MRKPSLDFTTFAAALDWAHTHAREHCHSYHTWRVVLVGRAWAIGIYSVNTGRLSHFAA